MSKGKIIFVVTNHSELGGKNITGWYLPEVAHPHHVLTEAGYKIVFVSPKGGESPMDKGSGENELFKNDPICQSFLAKNEHVKVTDKATVLKDTLTASKINPKEYKALFYAGGHGPMFDLPGATDIADLAAEIYKQGGVLSAVCHGTVGLVPVKVDGKPIVKGKKVTCFTNAEEDAVELSKLMPFMLETKLKELDADFVAAENWACNVQVSERLITGQNPASASKVAEAMVAALGK